MSEPLKLLSALAQANFRGKAWQGAALAGAVRGVSAAEALRRPSKGRRNIHELVLHAAYWKYAVRRRLNPAEDAPFPVSPANWPATPASPDAEEWKRAVKLLKREHEKLVRAIEGLDAGSLDQIPPGARTWTRAQLIMGIASHDAYHTGQIQLLKKLIRTRGS
ncbi:MAG: DinB family protein [Leptolyngbya sp. PLA1]|nr:DinB family protein [Leptolyngbya sp. PLA1]